MLDKIIHFSIHNKLIIGILTLGLIIWGLFSASALPIDAIPDITNNQVQIITTSPKLATQEVEQFITYPIEQSVKSIPDVIELRSISRFGLSVITVVFKESTDIYWARTQINERLKEAEEIIPNGAGKPELAPVSTGLGEIYQYVIFPKKGYEDKYDITELRTIQDWIIKPQLQGIPGVAEINTLGGKLKQYEIAVSPDKLRSMHTTITEIFEALEVNNENTGGAYIDKKPYAYFIRGIGMVSSLDDIRKIVVKNENGIPILIRDVAEVRMGHSVRYGAVTMDGKGEEVSGMVMMLKGENSGEVVKRVKERMAQIEKTLPEGVEVKVYLDRTDLVNKAISTVRNNLVEGALIVIFILVLLLGNWRAGLIVASVIPLSLLFAFSMMKLFGVSGNLMSLGAIDFGLIVDGSVIFVEAIVHKLYHGKNRVMTQQEMDGEVLEASSKIRSSSAFGQIIILMVYLPILALSGIEGKMFGPMAQTVTFAILGAFILSLTYVPMMSALALNKKIIIKRNFSDKIMDRIHRLYEPILNKAFRIKHWVIGCALLLFAGSLLLFSRMGGEFIPSLDEGDLAGHLIIASGSSLSQETDATLKAQKMLMKNFPEVKMIVAKIGSGEIPTDPMPVEAADLVILMKDQKEWTSAESREEMMEKMQAVLENIPGATIEFSQPIQMRFNELMTGVRTDVAIKIYGEDLEQLSAQANQVLKKVVNVDGVTDARAERISGLPQITVRYNKDKLALYGLKIGDLNKVLRMGFAGETAGVVYEGEKRFDLVVRLTEDSRSDISNLRSLYVTLPSGNQIPLEQIADIQYEDGPMQISRDNGKRRIVVGFNVRNRDVASVVEEIQDKLDKEIQLPPGYYMTYGGQFENLQDANARLSIAVPIALALIFLLLYLNFKSISQSLLIFTAIPLSAIGGVIALYLRDMPFSISAGVGFITLFGVAVLNGIVLIGYFNQLKLEGVVDILERIKKGTEVRLRPVVMTASVASFGFFPMALSTSAGAEVQKPLATVVIGGLVSATILTLIVLPILYYFLETWKERKSKISIPAAVIIVLIGTCLPASAQEHKLSLDEAIQIAKSQNLSIQSAQLNSEAALQRTKSAWEIPKTEFGGQYGQISSQAKDQYFSVGQTFNPFTISARKKLLKAEQKETQLELANRETNITYQVRNSWNELLYFMRLNRILEKQAAVMEKFVKSAEIKFKVGETNSLEKNVALAKSQRLQQLMAEYVSQINIQKARLQVILNSKENFVVADTAFVPWPVALADTSAWKQNPEILLAEQLVQRSKAEWNVEKSAYYPELQMGYFTQSITGNQEINGQPRYFDGGLRFQGWTFGLNIPIFFGSTSAKVKAAKILTQSKEKESEYVRSTLGQQFTEQQQQLAVYQNQIEYYTETGLPIAQKIMTNATKSYRNGDLSYVEYVQSLETANDILMGQAQAIRNYNQTLAQLLYLISQ